MITASFLLGMCFYPFALKKWTQFVEWLYWSAHDKKEKDKPEEPTPKTSETPPFSDKNEINLRQSTPKTATNLEIEKGIEKVPTFAASTDSDPEIKDVHVTLEKEERLAQEEFDQESESVKLEGFGPDAVLASGVVYDELIKTRRVIQAPVAGEQEEKDAGRVIYQNQNTELFEPNAQTALRISNLLDIHLSQLAREQQTEKQESVKHNRQLDSRDFKDFDINSIF